MAGHSKWANIKHRKGRQDKVRAKAFNRASREIMVAVKEGGGPEPDNNPRLRGAIQAARAANMPNDRIKKAIDSAAGTGDGANYEEVRYEGYGPGGVAIIVDALTDNRNRTVGEVRAAFSKYGGELGADGAVSFMFDRVGSIFYTAETADADAMFEAAVEAGADNVESTDDGHDITTSIDNFAAVRDALVEKYGAAERAELVWQPQTTIAPSEDQAGTLLKLIEVLEDNDDVQTVSANFDIADDVMERLVG